MSRGVALLALAALTLTACAETQVLEHVAASDIGRPPQRIMIVNRMGTLINDRVTSAVSDAMRAELARCQVTAASFRPDGAQAEADARSRALRAQLQPDAALFIDRASDRERRFTFWLYDTINRRDLWKARVSATGPLLDAAVFGERLAHTVVRTMAEDGVLTSCVPSPARPTPP